MRGRIARAVPASGRMWTRRSCTSRPTPLIAATPVRTGRNIANRGAIRRQLLQVRGNLFLLSTRTGHLAQLARDTRETLLHWINLALHLVDPPEHVELARRSSSDTSMRGSPSTVSRAVLSWPAHSMRSCIAGKHIPALRRAGAARQLRHRWGRHHRRNRRAHAQRCCRRDADRPIDSRPSARPRRLRRRRCSAGPRRGGARRACRSRQFANDSPFAIL